MHRRLVASVFAVLLLAMQQEAQWHALGHDRDLLQRPHEQGLQLPLADEVCAICALFAGGSTAATSRAAALPEPVAGHTAPRYAFSSPTAAAPSYYLSRAPPILF